MMKTVFFMKNHLTKKMFFTALFVALFTANPLSSTLFAQGVTPDHVAKMKNVTNSVVSNDGKFVAYTLSTPADPFKENAPNSSHLYILNTETGESKPYFTSANVSGIAFRPVKGTFTFLSREQGDDTNAIYEVDVNEEKASKVYSYISNILSYTWQADGRHLAFSINERGAKPATPLTYSPDFYEEQFSTRRAFIHDVENKDANPQFIDVNGSVYMMNWNADGTKLAVSVAPTTSVDDSFMKQQVMVVNGSTGKVIATVENEGKLGQIQWSPDGKWLALKAGKDINDPIDGRILIVSAEGGKPQIINANYKGKYENILWAEANVIHFHASQGIGSVLGTIHPDGTGKQVIFESPQYAITSFSRGANGEISFVASSPSHPAELYTIGTTRNAQPQQRTNNNPWLADVKLGKQEVVTYTARDGEYDIEGILIYPLDYTAGAKVPLITVVHGGPEAHYSNGWLTGYSTPGQMAAAKGYAVFYPNYRGSTGRGVDFAYSSQGDLGGKEFDDIVDGVDYLIAQGIADEKRIGVTGGSYGGYASAWMSTYYSDRFAAAVMFVGISNNISKWGTSDIPEEMYHVHSRKRVWDHWQWNLERSPIYYVERSQTPILIMHGADDPRVHPAQSMELYRHIKVRKPNLPVRLIYYPGEGHGNARSGSKYDYNLRMLQWFDTYLKTGDATAQKPSLDLSVE